MININKAFHELVDMGYFAEKIQKTIKPYIIQTNKDNIFVYKNSIEKIKEELKQILKKYQNANERTQDNFVLQIEKHNENHIVKIHTIKDNEIIKTYTFGTTLTEIDVKQYDINDVKHLSLIELLKNTNHENEIEYCYDQLVDLEVENTLDEGWLDIQDLLKENSIYNYEQKEINYFSKLTDEQKQIFAYSHAYSYANMLMNQPLNYWFKHYDIKFINTLFNEIEFVEN